MPYFKKKPVVIEAHQWLKNGDHPEDNSILLPSPNEGTFLSEGQVVRRYRVPGMSGENTCRYCKRDAHDHGWIDTLEGGHVVCPGDWIITGVHGERYPCKPEIFEKTYEFVSNEEDK